jgi:hypothetical protein
MYVCVCVCVCVIVCVYIYLYISSEAALADATGDMGVAEEGMSEERATQDAVAEDTVAREGVAQHGDVHGEAHDGAAGVVEVEVEGVGQVVEASEEMDEEATRATHVSSSSYAHMYPPHMASEEMNEEVSGATHEPVALGALPAGWQACTDSQTGRTFYQNTVTQTTQWEYPSNAADVGLGGVGGEGERVVVEGSDEGESIGITRNTVQACNTMQAMMAQDNPMAQDNAVEGVQDHTMQGIMAQEASVERRETEEATERRETEDPESVAVAPALVDSAEGEVCVASGMRVQHFAAADQGGG